MSEAKSLNQPILTIFKASNDIDTDIVEISNQGDYDLLLIGLGQSIFDGTLLGKVLGITTSIINPDRLLDKFTGREGLFANSPFDERTRLILAKAKMPVGILVLVEKNLEQINKVFLPIFSEDDRFLIDYAARLIRNGVAAVTLIDPNNVVKNNSSFYGALDLIERDFPGSTDMLEDRIIKKEFLAQQDIMLVSLESWRKLVSSQSVWLSNSPSTLIMRA